MMLLDFQYCISKTKVHISHICYMSGITLIRSCSLPIVVQYIEIAHRKIWRKFCHKLKGSYSIPNKLHLV